MSPCRHPGCPKLLPVSGYCDQHGKAVNQSRADYDQRRKSDLTLARSAAIRSSLRWKKVARLKINANPLCEDPLQNHKRRNMTESSTQVHHVSGLAIAPEKAFEWDNLMAVCTKCHALLEAKERKRDR